jgi:antirestriction protein ArdC
MTGKTDLYQRVTVSIVADLEKGVRPWQKPWGGQYAAPRIVLPRRSTGQGYRGINILLLWSVILGHGYRSPFFVTYRQAQALGGQVRRGEQGAPVFYAGRLTKTETTAKGDEVEKSIPFMRSYTVFNAEQVDGLPPHFYPEAAQPLPEAERIEVAESYFANIQAVVKHGGRDAVYYPGPDFINMPVIQAFDKPEFYYTTRFHETAHWTSHKKRLNRDFTKKYQGKEAYAFEELVAELSSAFWSAAMGLEPITREDHNTYLGHWAKALKEDTRAIFKAAAYAQKVVDYLDAMQPGHVAQGEGEGDDGERRAA